MAENLLRSEKRWRSSAKQLALLNIFIISFVWADESAVRCNVNVTISKIMESVKNVMRFLSRNKDVLIGDVSLGLVIAKHELMMVRESLIHETFLTESRLSEIDWIIALSSSLIKPQNLDANVVEEVKNDPKFFDEFTPSLSDYCLSQIMGCDVNERCLNLTSTTGTTGYLLTHQFLYYVVVLMHECHERFGDMKRVEERYTSQAFKILLEATEISRGGFPEDDRDLFLEQLALCGVANVYSPMMCRWMNVIVTWQRQSGCFDMHDGQDFSYKELASRVKRDDQILEGNCSEHKTAVGLGALVTGLKYLLKYYA